MKSTPSHINKLGQPIGEPLQSWVAPAHPGVPIIEGQYVRLERLAQRHAEELFNAFMEEVDDATWTYLPYGPFKTQPDFQAWLTPFAQSNDPWMFALIDLRTGRACGVASYLRINPESGSVEVGHIHYGKSLKKTRAATEAMYLMAEHVFKLGYRRYEWKCDALNSPSQNSAKRLGFTFEGIFRQATIYKQRNRDTAWLSILDKDWSNFRIQFQRWLSDENFDENGHQIESLNSQNK